MNYFLGKKLYIESCFEELEIFKPGNQNMFTNFSSSKILKFREAAKISSNILCDKNLNLGESIFFSSKKCFDQLGSNFNLGIILLCAPILKIFIKGKFLDLRSSLSLMLKNITKKEGYLILKAIKYSQPAGLKNYIGKGNVNSQDNYLDFNEVMKIGSRWDRISKCYTDSFSEIFDFGLPFYRKLKLHQCSNNAGINVFLSYLSNSTDSPPGQEPLVLARLPSPLQEHTLLRVPVHQGKVPHRWAAHQTSRCRLACQIGSRRYEGDTDV